MTSASQEVTQEAAKNDKAGDADAEEGGGTGTCFVLTQEDRCAHAKNGSARASHAGGGGRHAPVAAPMLSPTPATKGGGTAPIGGAKGEPVGRQIGRRESQRPIDIQARSGKRVERGSRQAGFLLGDYNTYQPDPQAAERAAAATSDADAAVATSTSTWTSRVQVRAHGTPHRPRTGTRTRHRTLLARPHVRD